MILNPLFFFFSLSIPYPFSFTAIPIAVSIRPWRSTYLPARPKSATGFCRSCSFVAELSCFRCLALPPLQLAMAPLLALAVLILVAGSGGPSSPVRTARSEPTRDRALLLAFMGGLRHEPRLQWNANASACDWVGVRCDSGRTAVLELRLPGAGLLGSVAGGSLGRLSGLRVLSLRSNRLSGPIPSELGELGQLQRLFLQGNLFSGGIPAGLVGLTLLLRLDLSRNNLTGPVPFALNNLTRLRGLFLENNNLTGSLPSISIASLKHFNVSYNKLIGSVPRSLAGFPAASFLGNLDLCGAPLPPCEPFFPSPSAAPAAIQVPTQRSSKRLSTAAIIGIIVASIAAFLVLLLLVVCVFFRLRRKGASRTKEKSAKGSESGTRATAATAGARSGDTGMTSSSKDEMSGSASALVEAERNKLVFVGSGAAEYSFDLEDLLRASAEVLGKGTTGTSYKAVLEEGTTVVVKRLKDVTAAKPEFDSLMHTLGHTEHPNLVAARAYYYSRDEKLLVLDYLPAGSLSSLLHGSRGAGRPPLGWENRMRVALAAGRGLAHLHTSAHLVHGNIKASNVLLRAGDHDSAALSDIGLHPLFHPALRIRPAGYLAPEVLETRRPTFKSDVYSFGVLLLELLTGKAPNQASLNDEGIDLPRWVQSVVREEWTAEVFDAELMRYADTEEEEMVQLLQIAMACVSATPDARPDIAEVVRMMEQIANRTEGNDGPKSSQVDPANGAGDVAGGDAFGATS